MFGGVVIGGVGPRRRAPRPVLPRPSYGVALALSVGLTSVLGVALTDFVAVELDATTLLDVRRVLRVVAGALFFGAGLVQLAAWRLDGSAPSRAHVGAGLVVLGLPTALLGGLGPLLHAEPVAATLNPLGAALVALATLVTAGAARRAAARGAGGPGSVAAFGVVVVATGFGGLVLLRHHAFAVPVASDTVQLALELGVAALWFGAAAASAGRNAGVPSGRTGALPAELMAVLGFVWLMRAAAVLDPSAWGLPSALLLGLVASVELTTAAAQLGTATDAVAAADRERREIKHEARNAMLALRLASRTLAEHGDRLDAATRTRLEVAVHDQVAVLEELLGRYTHRPATLGQEPGQEPGPEPGQEVRR